MDYNTSRNKLKMPEYGRNIQRMVEMLTEIPEAEKRDKYVDRIISIIEQLNPGAKDVKDYKKKLRDHIYLMSDFKLEIEYLDGYKPSKEKIIPNPNQVPYRSNRIKFKHYGSTVEKLLQHAAKMEDGEKKDILIALVANHMKKLYLIWNDRQTVTDEDIFRDIATMTKNKVDIPDGIVLSSKENLPTGNFQKKKKKKKKRRK
jgi:hypothetical protein